MRQPVVLFFLLCAAGAWSQVAVQGPRPIYEGQNVTAIDLIGNPHRDLEPLRSLVQQKAGQPYSES
ncbi:MAG TPA: hypothetical protein VK641_06545, partial [Terriglobales bacterium]|nr:hypothetical protein [Terriglobales bacterium]